MRGTFSRRTATYPQGSFHEIDRAPDAAFRLALRGLGLPSYAGGAQMMSSFADDPRLSSSARSHAQEQIVAAVSERVAATVTMTPGTIDPCAEGWLEECAALRAHVDVSLDVAPDDPAAIQCGCYLDAVAAYAAAQGFTLTSAQRADLDRMLPVCEQDPAAFRAQLLDANHVPYESCKPWYRRRITLMVGGGIALAGLAWWALR
jgi:hypothetical protein